MKSGFKTSEFWLVMLTGAITAGMQYGKVDPQIQESVLKVLLPALIAYIASRFGVKAVTAWRNGS